MANLRYLLNSAPFAYRTIFCRFSIFALSITALALYATTLDVYNTDIAPAAGSLTPLHNDLSVFTGVSLVAATISIVWSVTMLSLLARRMLQTHRRDRGGLAAIDEGQDEWDRNRPLVPPVWEIGLDTLCGALMIAGATLTGTAWNNWKTGTLGPGWEGTTPVKLGACPSFDPVTGMLSYWCGPEWKRLLGLMFNGMNVLSPNAGLHLSQSLRACYYLYCLRRSRRGMEDQAHGKNAGNRDSRAPLSHQTQQIELDRIEKGSRIL